MSAAINAKVNTQNFDEQVMQSTQPVLVDFWAPWCGPCRAQAPILDELAGEYAGRAGVVKVNVDDHPQLAGRFGITSIPTLILFSGGKVVFRETGAQGKAVLSRALDAAL